MSPLNREFTQRSKPEGTDGDSGEIEIAKSDTENVTHSSVQSIKFEPK